MQGECEGLYSVVKFSLFALALAMKASDPEQCFPAGQLLPHRERLDALECHGVPLASGR